MNSSRHGPASAVTCRELVYSLKLTAAVTIWGYTQMMFNENQWQTA